MAFLAQKLMYTINTYLTLRLAHFFEQDHLLNLSIFGIYAKRLPKYARISKQKLKDFK